ncbi:hypothetical protein L593_05980 [Salinarchaeum sp. Harcht-Bsk1]|nr:hypothetical protein L593_05980 [Salinarchaeum sp. Harcht-Bsk1]
MVALMPETTTKTVKVPDSRAEKWDEYVQENPEVDSISHLIRLAVQREIDNDRPSAQPVADPTEDTSSGEILTAVQGIQTAVSDLEERMSALEEVEKAEASYDLQKAIYAVLPEDPDCVIDDEIPGPENVEEADPITAREIAQLLGADYPEVEGTIDGMVEATAEVQRSDVNHDGRYYWKRGAGQ